MKHYVRWALPLWIVAAAVVADESGSAVDTADQTPKPAEVQLEAALPQGFPAPGPADVVQIKHYPAYRVAKAEGRNAFGQLFAHITKRGIAMTAPVEMTLEQAQREAQGEVQGDAEEGVRAVDMMFMYARPDMGELGPDDTVEVMDLPPVTVFSLGHFGDGGPDAQAAALAQVHAAVGLDPAWEPAAAARRLGYSSPFVPRERRYWEVQVPVRAVKKHEADEDPAAAVE